jgi:Glycosyltransferase family 87
LFGAGLGIALATLLLSTSFRQGWMRVETDFPNYYTGAAAARAGLPLKNFYDWTWFQREMNYTGTERQLGAYTPQSPLALLPFLPVARLGPQRAKQVWLSLNAVLLACTIVLLARVSELAYRWVFSIFLACYGSLHSNFLLGQYYVFLAFLLALSAFLFFRGREGWAGSSLGILFALKLYSGPFLLFFLIKRRWRAAASFIGVAVIGATVSIAMFGWSANSYYVQSVLPSLASGMLIDPYNAGLGSMTALLRRTFVAEPELNPQPMIPSHAAFVFCQSLFFWGLLAIAVLVLSRPERLIKREFAWLTITLLLMAPVNATYVFVLLAIPAAMLMPECGVGGRMLWLGGLAIAGAPLPRDMLPLFPRLFVLWALYLWVGWPILAGLRRQASVTIGAVAFAATLLALRPAAREPFERLIQPNHSLAVMEPAICKNGPIYHGFGDGRYVLRTASRDYSFDGHAFHAAALPAGGPVLFELVAQGHSRIMKLDLNSGSAVELVGTALDPQQPAISTDGMRAAFVSGGTLWISDSLGVRPLGIEGTDPSFSTDGSRLLFAHEGRLFSLLLDSRRVEPLVTEGRDLRHPVMSRDGSRLAFSGEHGGRQIWWRNLPDGKLVQLTSTRCNHDWPVWEADSRHLMFTSDCGRGLGLPALYRAEASEMQGPQ